jgi:hypothetical protein
MAARPEVDRMNRQLAARAAAGGGIPPWRAHRIGRYDSGTAQQPRCSRPLEVTRTAVTSLVAAVANGATSAAAAVDALLAEWSAGLVSQKRVRWLSGRERLAPRDHEPAALGGNGR